MTMGPDLSRRLAMALTGGDLEPWDKDPIIHEAERVTVFEELPEWAQRWITDREALHREWLYT